MSIVIDISGPQGNAFCLLGIAKQLADELGRDYKEIEKNMTSSNYDNLVHVFEHEFEGYVEVMKAQESLIR